jgi:hypothetical protein
VKLEGVREIGAKAYWVTYHMIEQDQLDQYVAAVRETLESKGYITSDELSDLLPEDVFELDDIDEFMVALTESGIDLDEITDH